MKTPQQGASTQVFAATSPLLAEIGGVYLAEQRHRAAGGGCDARWSLDIAAGPLRSTPGVTPYAVDPESAERLWALSEKLLTA